MTFDATRIPLKIIAGSKSGDTNAVALAFYPETEADSNRLFDALMRMRERGHFDLDTAIPREHGQKSSPSGGRADPADRSSPAGNASPPAGAPSSKATP